MVQVAHTLVRRSLLLFINPIILPESALSENPLLFLHLHVCFHFLSLILTLHCLILIFLFRLLISVTIGLFLNFGKFVLIQRDFQRNFPHLSILSKLKALWLIVLVKHPPLTYHPQFALIVLGEGISYVILDLNPAPLQVVVL